MSARRLIRMFVDAGAEWPLWEDGTDRYPGQPSHYALSGPLTAKLRAWQDEWDRGFDVATSPPRWRPGCVAGWSERGVRIAALLREEVGAYADVRYNDRSY